MWSADRAFVSAVKLRARSAVNGNAYKQTAAVRRVAVVDDGQRFRPSDILYQPMRMRTARGRDEVVVRSILSQFIFLKNIIGFYEW